MIKKSPKDKTNTEKDGTNRIYIHLKDYSGKINHATFMRDKLTIHSITAFIWKATNILKGLLLFL